MNVAGRVAAPLASTEVIANTLREEISLGELHAGAPLKQDEIAARFSVSHTPVREALKLLVAEGWAVLHHNRGVFVAGLSSKVANELTEYRCILEPQMVKWSVPNLSTRDISKGREIIRRIDYAHNLSERLRLATQFHNTIYGPADRPFFLAEINKARSNLNRYWRLAWQSVEFPPSTQKEHVAIIDLCEAGETEKLAVLIETHVRQSGEMVIRYLRQGEE